MEQLQPAAQEEVDQVALGGASCGSLGAALAGMVHCGGCSMGGGGGDGTDGAAVG